MVTSKVDTENNTVIETETLSNSKKRRLRRQKLRLAKSYKTQSTKSEPRDQPTKVFTTVLTDTVVQNIENNNQEIRNELEPVENNILQEKANMSSKEITEKPRDDVLAAREAKKLAKQKAKSKVNDDKELVPNKDMNKNKNESVKVEPKADTAAKNEQKSLDIKSKDEVDRAVVHENAGDKERDKIKAERAAKKAAKQAKKKGDLKKEEGSAEGGVKLAPETSPAKQEENNTAQAAKVEVSKVEDMTVKDVVETLKDIVNVAKEVKEVTAKVQSIDLGGKKQEELGKTKAELKAERRAKQEAQRAAKQLAEQKAKPKEDASAKLDIEKVKEVKPVKVKVMEKSKSKSQIGNRINWWQHLCKDHDKDALRKIAINSNLHPAIVKLGVQMSSGVVTGSNARCIALLDALKKMVRDYTVPAKTEFGRGLESHLATSLEFLWSMRQPSASQANAVKFFRHHIMQLPNNVDEFDAKKTLQEEIDRYIREQIDMAGQAISIAVRNKISNGDNILTYGCSSLIERILVEAWEAGVRFRIVVVGNRVQQAGTEMLRRLTAKGLPCTYVDYTGLHFVMSLMKLVLVGCDALLADGSVRGAVGSAGVALAARLNNVPVLVAAETHKFSEQLQTDAFQHNQLGDPDDLIDKNDENSPLKDWRSNPNLTPLNLTYDLTPPSLVTAVVTELAILPCTSAPVVLRFKLSEYGM